MKKLLLVIVLLFSVVSFAQEITLPKLNSKEFNWKDGYGKVKEVRFVFLGDKPNITNKILENVVMYSMVNAKSSLTNQLTFTPIALNVMEYEGNVIGTVTFRGKTAEHNILTIVKSNEIEEFAATFPERTEELLKLKENYDLLTAKLNMVWDELKICRPKNISKEEQKKYAIAVFEVCKTHKVENFTGLYFGLAQYKVNSVEEFLLNYDDKLLYKIL
jgi:hypothetical protein